MLYKFDNDKYELCKKYIMEVYDGNKKNVEMYDVSKSIIVSENSVNDFMDAADCFVTEQFPYPALLNPI